MTPPLIEDFAALTAEIPGDNPAGTPLPFEISAQLDNLRRQAPPAEPEPGPTCEWQRIVTVATSALANKSKDLIVAARLVEGLTWRYEFPGLRDGLRVLRELLEQCWDRLYPMLESDNDPGIRMGALNWLNDKTRASRLPLIVNNLPLVKFADEEYTRNDWGKPDRQSAFDNAIANMSREEAQTLFDDVTGCAEELLALGRIADERFGSDAPALSSKDSPTNLGWAVFGVLEVVEHIFNRKGGADVPADATSAAASSGSNGVMPTLSAGTTNREGLYELIRQAANGLRRIEPHSPIPFLILRACDLGKLEFPQLMKKIIREPATLSEIDRMLGLDEEASSGG